MTMRTYHGALLLVLAMVMAMLPTGNCTGTTPVPAAAPTALESGAWLKYPHDHKCLQVLPTSGSRCVQKACNDNCFTKLKGSGVCLVGTVRQICSCYYPCKMPPQHAW